jgi:nucleobase:cation symporter-1, NCS1 family
MTAVAEVEVPYTLEDAPPPRLLGLWDITVLWGNLGVSILLLPVAPIIVFALPESHLSLTAALVAIVVGTAIGNTLLGLAAIPGAETGAPSMVLLRGLFGARGSWVPTALNIAQLIGWTTFEIWIIAETAAGITSDGWKPVFAIAAGAFAVLMATRPLGTVRGYLKRVAVWVVLVSTVYLFVQVLRRDPLNALGGGDWGGFWKSADLVISLSVSWIPLAADYTRHARSARSAFFGAAFGYAISSAAFFTLGVLAVFSDPEQTDVIGSLVAIPAGGLALLMLAADEIDEVFANLYSTVVSMQNVRPQLDRRLGAIALGVLCTIGALVIDGHDYELFLLVIGSVFVPLFATFAVDYFVVQRRRWDVSDRARPRWAMLVPWLAGFVTYQLINPGGVGWWSRFWGDGPYDAFFDWTWASASILSFAVAAVLAYVIGMASRERART